MYICLSNLFSGSNDLLRVSIICFEVQMIYCDAQKNCCSVELLKRRVQIERIQPLFNLNAHHNT